MVSRKGYTLIELMITVAVMGILAAIGSPKLGKLIDKAKDANTKGNLGALRAALSIYNGNTEGRYPAYSSPYDHPAGYDSLLHDTLVPNFIDKIPKATPSGGKHRASDSVLVAWNLSGNQDNEPTSGHGWTYDGNPFEGEADKPAGFRGMWGTIRVLCQHNDSKGVNWSTY